MNVPESKNMTATYSITAHIREFFFLEGHQARSRSLETPLRTFVEENWELSCKRLLAAEVLRDAGSYADALPLYWVACERLARAYLGSARHSLELSALEKIPLLKAFAEELESNKSPLGRQLKEILPLRPKDEKESDGLPRRESAHRAAELHGLLRQLADLVRPRHPRTLKLLSRLRIMVAILTLLGIPLVFFLISLIPSNLAMHQKVTASSQFEENAPSKAVDDRIYGRFGFHSNQEVSPWLMIDLGQTQMLTDAQIFGRHDCCFDQSIPLVFEISLDGESFVEVATKTDKFVSLEPWIIESIKRPARFVRLRKPGKGFLVLSEVIVNGREL